MSSTSSLASASRSHSLHLDSPQWPCYQVISTAQKLELECPEPSPLWSHKVAPSVMKRCSTNSNQWGSDGKLVGSHLHSQWVSHLFKTTQVFVAGDGTRDRRSWKVEMAWPALHFVHLQKLFHVGLCHPTVTQFWQWEPRCCWALSNIDFTGSPTTYSPLSSLALRPWSHGPGPAAVWCAAAPCVHASPGQVSSVSLAKLVCELTRTCAPAQEHLIGTWHLTWCTYNGLLMWQKLTEAEVRSS